MSAEYGAPGVVGLTMDYLESMFDVMEHQTVTRYAPLYDDARGLPLYTNIIPSTLPGRAVVALVKQECRHCHAFMAAAEYPRTLPDSSGTPMIYIDMHNPNPDGSDTPALAFYRALGLTGNVPWEHLKLHGKDVPGANIPYVPVIPIVHFPILLHVVDGAVNGALAAGVHNALQRFETLRNI